MDFESSKPQHGTAQHMFLRKFSAMAIGNMMEWFDFSAFGALIDIIAINFFPSFESHHYKLLQSLGFFGAAFLMRPLGGILMGYIGDRVNRKRALEVSILMMFIPSLAIGCLPTYKTAGIASYLILLILRLIQGLAAGGEMIGAFLYTLESRDGQSVGFWGGACKASGNLGTAIGVGLVTLLRVSLTNAQMLSWGWRVPFLCSLIFGVIGLCARMRLKDDDHDRLDYEQLSDDKTVPSSLSAETQQCMEAEKEEMASNEEQRSADPPANDIVPPTIHSPLRQVLQQYRAEIVIILLVTSFWGCCFYTCFVWLVYFMQDPEMIGGGSKAVSLAWEISFVANTLLVIALPLAGSVGDCFGDYLESAAEGCRYAMQVASVLMFLLAIPAFLLIVTKQNGNVFIGQLLLLIPVALYGANLPFFMMSMIDSKQLRYTAMGVGYNLSHAIFSSTTSIVQTTLVLSDVFASDRSNRQSESVPHDEFLSDPRLRPAFYLMIISALAWTTLTFAVDMVRPSFPAQKPIASTEDHSLVNQMHKSQS